MVLARRIVDFQPLAQRIERVALAGVQLARQRQAVGDGAAQVADAAVAQAIELGVEEADVELGVVDDQFGAGDELGQLDGDLLERRMLGEELLLPSVPTWWCGP